MWIVRRKEQVVLADDVNILDGVWIVDIGEKHIAPEILDAMGRDAPESFSPPAESDPQPMQVAQ